MRTRLHDGRSRGRLLAAFGWLVLLLSLAIFGECSRARASQREPIFIQTVIIKHQETHDTRGIQFFEIRNAQGSALVSVDGSLELAKALRGLDGRKVRLVIEGAELERIVRFGGER